MPDDEPKLEPWSKIPDEYKPLIEKARAAVLSSAKNRLKHALPENSEPCFSYKAEPRGVRKR